MSRAQELIDKGKVLVEFRYPVERLVGWLQQEVAKQPVKVRYRRACGPYIKADAVRLQEHVLVVDCPLHGTERAKVVV